MSENNLPENIKSGVLGKIWEDIFSPTASRIGKALGGITGCMLSSIRKYEFYDVLNDTTFQVNLAKYREALEAFTYEQIVEVPAEIAKPTVDRLEYIKNKELSQAFITLLTNASSRSGCHLAHPSFIHILDRLSSDEAKIIQYMKTHGGFPLLQVHSRSTSSESMIEISAFMTGLEKEIDLIFSDNLKLYMNNLISLGIVQYNVNNSPFKNRASELEHVYKDDIADFYFLVEDPKTIQKIPCWIELTALGKKFIEACLTIA